MFFVNTLGFSARIEVAVTRARKKN